MNKILCIVILILIIPIAGLFSADAAVIMQKMVDIQNTGNMAMDMRMNLIESNGDKSTRRLQTLTRKSEDGLSQTITVFIEPASVKNTRFLTIENTNRNNDQWIYLPALRKVKRIAASEREGSFMGSDFSYADMEPSSIDDSSHNLLREETFAKKNCYVIETVPHSDSDSVYGKTVSWIEKNTYLPIKIEFYSRKSGSLIKSLVSEGYNKENSHWIAERMIMTSADSGHKTVLEIIQVKHDISLNPAYFTVNYLKTGKAQ
jgi:hypothetical protein